MLPTPVCFIYICHIPECHCHCFYLILPKDLQFAQYGHKKYEPTTHIHLWVIFVKHYEIERDALSPKLT